MIPDPLAMIPMPRARNASTGTEPLPPLLGRLAWESRDAQEEARLAYAAWSAHPGADAYAVYRAAQDRADAAQDMLARRYRAD
jgi:hypothetical protein